MHEYSIVQSLLNSCEDNAKSNGASKVIKVVTKIGVLSGVEPDLLQTAFDTFKEKTMCEDAEFIMNIQPVVIKCNSCGKESTLEKSQFACHHCEGVDIEVLEGEEMYLMQLEVE